MRGGAGGRVHLIAKEEQIVALVKADGVGAVENEMRVAANAGEEVVDPRGVDGVGRVAGEAEQNGAVGAVAEAGEGERAEELHADACGAIEMAGGGELTGEAEGRAHGANGVRARRADADLEELEEAGVHGSIVGVTPEERGCALVAGLRTRRTMASAPSVGDRSAVADC